MEFICVEETENSVTHLLESTDETKKAWPYEFQLYITHTLEGRDLTVAWKVDEQRSGDHVFYGRRTSGI